MLHLFIVWLKGKAEKEEQVEEQNNAIAST
jgi:hypothetical protein